MLGWNLRSQMSTAGIGLSYTNTPEETVIWVEHRSGPRRNHKWELVEKSKVEVNQYITNLLFSHFESATSDMHLRKVRGYPKHCSETVKSAIKRRRSSSWMTLLELLRHDWNDNRHKFEGYVSLNQAILMKKGIFPNYVPQQMFHHNGGIKVISNEQMEQFVRAFSSESGPKRFETLQEHTSDLTSDYFTHMSWTRSDADFYPDFVNNLEKMKTLDRDFNRVRMIYAKLRK